MLFLDLEGGMILKVLDEQMMQVPDALAKVAFGTDPEYLSAYNLIDRHSPLSPILRRWRVRLEEVRR